MRKNSMTKCAVGAMLFGGTLGMSQAASAGLAFTTTGVLPSFNSENRLENYSNDFVYSDVSNDGSLALSATTLALPASGGLSASWTATSNTSGFNVDVLTSATTGLQNEVLTSRYFTVTDTQQITMNWTDSFSVLISKNTSGTSYFGEIQDFTLSGSLTTTLTAGLYRVSSELNGLDTASFSFAVVPAPGALALLGAAGLVGARRRRA